MLPLNWLSLFIWLGLLCSTVPNAVFGLDLVSEDFVYFPIQSVSPSPIPSDYSVEKVLVGKYNLSFFLAKSNSDLRTIFNFALPKASTLQNPKLQIQIYENYTSANNISFSQSSHNSYYGPFQNRNNFYYKPFQTDSDNNNNNNMTGAEASNQCKGVAITSDTAIQNNCKIAINAGFFNVAASTCIGNVISNNSIIQVVDESDSNSDRVNFGITKNGNFIMGYIQPSTIQTNTIDGGIISLIQGLGWLIRNGTSYLNESINKEHIQSSFVNVAAPRTAIGHNDKGQILIAEIDGEEDIKAGPSLYEWTDILLKAGFVNGINLDGGGSATVVVDGKVFDQPTCNDTPVICQRPVTTIACLTQ